MKKTENKNIVGSITFQDMGLLDRINRCSDKAAALADVDLDNATYDGKTGMRYYLRDLSDELSEIGRRLSGEEGENHGGPQSKQGPAVAESKVSRLPTKTKAPSSTMDKTKASADIGRLCAMMDFLETTFFSNSEGRERLAAIANDEQAWNGLAFLVSGVAENLRGLEGAILTAPDLPACRG